MSANYYMEPVESSEQTYYMEIVESVASDYYMELVGADEYEEEMWGLVCVITLNSDDWATLARVPGSYDGYIDYMVLNSYKRVKVVGKSGAWDDGGGAPSWHGFCDVVTKVDYATIGPTGPFDTEGEAASAFVGWTEELTLGIDKKIYWGIYDIAGSNSGVVVIEIYAQ